MQALQVGHYNLSRVFCAGADDVKLAALDSTWEQIYNGDFPSDVGLQVHTSSMLSCSLGDFLAFCFSHGALESRGRLVAMALKIVEQVGEYMHQHQERPWWGRLSLILIFLCLVAGS